MTRADQLRKHVDTVTDKPMEWGVDDCSPWCARWIYQTTGIIVRIPAKYESRDEAKAIIKSAGGLLNLWTDALAEAGIFERYDEPKLGDIALIDTADHGPIGTIAATAGIFICRHEAGASFLTPRRESIVKVWALPE